MFYAICHSFEYSCSVFMVCTNFPALQLVIPVGDDVFGLRAVFGQGHASSVFDVHFALDCKKRFELSS